MSIAVTFNGVSYTIPSPGEAEWATTLNTFLQALASWKTTTAITAASPSGTTPAITATGHVGSNSAGVVATAGGAAGGIEATGGASGGSGVSGQGGGTTGVGVWGTGASGGYGVTAQGDTTSPLRSALRIVPQDNTPSGANAVGDIWVTTAGVLKICTVAGTPGTFVSVGSQT